MDWLGLCLKVWSWKLIGKRSRAGFLVAVLSNILLGLPALWAEMYAMALACFLTSIIQLQSWRKWE